MNFEKTGARWIWKNNRTDAVNQFVTFQQKFYIDKDSVSRLYICCDTNYIVKINGVFVETGQYLSYPTKKYYDDIDISKFVFHGFNTIEITVFYQGISTSCYCKGRPGLIYFIKCDERIIPNDEVMCIDGCGYLEGEQPMISAQLGPSLSYDATIEKNGEFYPAVKLPFSEILTYNIAKRPIKKLNCTELSQSMLVACGNYKYTKNGNTAQKMQTSLLSPVSKREYMVDADIKVSNGNTYLVFDLGEEISGFFECDFISQCEFNMDIAYGEHLQDLRVRSSIGDRNFAFSYKAKVGENKFTHYFRRIAGRYIQIHIGDISGMVNIHYIGIRKACYPIAEKTVSFISDSLDKKIYSVCVNTLRQCMHEHYEDTPWREQSLYASDSRNQALIGYSVFGNYGFAKASIDLLRISLRDDGFLDLCAPSDIPITIPCFSFIWIISVCEYVEYSSDIKYCSGQVKL